MRTHADTATITATRDGRPVPLGELDDVVRTELLRALEMAAGER